MRCRIILELNIRRDGKHAPPGISPGRAAGAARGDGRDAGARHHAALQAELEDLHPHLVQLRHSRQAPARTVLSQLRRAHRTRRRARREIRSVPARGRIGRFRQLPEPQQDARPRHGAVVPDARRQHASRSRDAVERFVSGEHVLLHEQHSAERRRHAPGRISRGADAHAQQLHREGTRGQEGKDRDDRR